MDGIALGLFLIAAFTGGFASGLAGFAMGFIVSGIWLHILTPLQTTALIVGYGLVTQSYGVWKLRHALVWRSIARGVIGVPIGTLLLTYLNPGYLRSGVGVLLIVYGAYGLAQPKSPARSRRPSCVCTCLACRRCLPACGSASGFTASSTTPRSAR